MIFDLPVELLTTIEHRQMTRALETALKTYGGYFYVQRRTQKQPCILSVFWWRSIGSVLEYMALRRTHGSEWCAYSTMGTATGYSLVALCHCHLHDQRSDSQVCNCSFSKKSTANHNCSQPLLAIAGVASAACGIVTAQGILHMCQVPIVQIAMIVPFLVLCNFCYQAEASQKSSLQQLVSTTCL